MYQELAEDVKEMLEEFGGPMTFSKEDLSGGLDDSGNPKAIEPTTFIEGVGVRSSFNSIERKDTSILITDVKILFYAETRPTVGMMVVVGGIKHRVIHNRIVSPYDIDVLYVLQVRNA